MASPTASPLLVSAVQRLLRALHAAYPQIATQGVQPNRPGLFIGEVAGKELHLIPEGRSPRMFIDKTGAMGRGLVFRYGFNLFKKGVAQRWEFDDEARLVLWLTSAAIELERSGSE